MFDGKPYRLCLTLGALAELEDAFAASRSERRWWSGFPPARLSAE
jgi:hypothetical protein